MFYINLPIGGAAFIILLMGFNPPKVKGNIKDRLKKSIIWGHFINYWSCFNFISSFIWW